MAKRALGRGLGALISKPKNAEKADDAPAVTSASEGKPVKIDVSLVDASPWQPRKTFDQEKLEELAASIKSQGLVQPIVVRQKDGRYELIAGERRLRAMKSLDWEKAPAVILDASDDRMRVLALIENLQRDDLNAMEIAYAYEELRKETGLTHEKLSDKLGVSRSKFTNMLRLLELPEEIKQFVSSGEIPGGQARALLALPDAMSQITLAKRIASEGMTTREVEQAVKHFVESRKTASKSKDKKEKAKDVHAQSLEDRMRDHFGTKVTIRDNGGKGTITLEYYSHDDVGRILNRMGLGDDLS